MQKIQKIRGNNISIFAKPKASHFKRGRDDNEVVDKSLAILQTK